MIKNITLGSVNAIKAYIGTSLVWDRGAAIKALFKDGKQGVWYDPSDKSTLFQDVAGTVPVTKDGDPVRLILDKSGNGNHAIAPNSASRPMYKTDGTLHWLDFDGVDDFLTAKDIDFLGQSFYTGLALSHQKTRYGGIGFIDNLKKSIFSTDFDSAREGRRGALQQFPNRIDAHRGMTTAAYGVPFVAWDSNGDTYIAGAIPSTPAQDYGEKAFVSVLSADLDIGVINNSHLEFKMYGCVYIAKIISVSERNMTNTYLSQKTGVTL